MGKQLSFNFKKSAKKSTKATNGGSVIAKAKRILDAQKRDWKRIWKDNVSGLQNAKSGAKRASAEYKKKYGTTPKARWQNAIKKAKQA